MSLLGSMGEASERVIRRVPSWVLPAWLVEILSRGLAPLCGPVAKSYRDGAEDRLRGIFSAGRYRAVELRLGRAVTVEGRSAVSLGEGVSLYGGVYVGATGERGRVEIGPHTHIDRNSIIYGQGGVRIGAGCAIASGVIVYSQSNQYRTDPTAPILDQEVTYAEVVVGDDVWIGAGAILLPGVRVGDHAVIAAGAVVRRDVEPWQIVAGVPARGIGDRRGSSRGASA
jgi:acetyltransferase-like isoleucine patch superfamily enzyme